MKQFPPGLPFFIGDTASDAVFDPTRKYRFSLWRRFEENCATSEMCAFIGLNGSKADEIKNDRTVARCINFAKAWGFKGYVMLNIFGYMATKPLEMFKQADPVGCWNDYALQIVPAIVGRTVCAWGANAVHRKLGMNANRPAMVRTWLRDYSNIYYLRMTKGGHPEHPLYVPAATEPQLWTSI